MKQQTNSSLKNYMYEQQWQDQDQKINSELDECSEIEHEDDGKVIRMGD